MQRLWMRLGASFWFLPSLVVLGSVAAAMLLVELGGSRQDELGRWSPRLFGVGADGSRAMLTAVATSMITVAGVVFSITMVTLSLSASQYSPRVLRNFMRDRPTQFVLGVFLGIFAYCLVVLRTIRGGDEGTFIPSVAVLGGMVYALGGIAVLIYFIHHVAQGIQASSILQRIGRDTADAIDHLFPQEMGSPAGEEIGDVRTPAIWCPVRSMRNGYVAAVDMDGLLSAAVEGDRLLRLLVPVGAYVGEGDVILEAGGGTVPDEAECRRLASCVQVARQRTVEQDAAFGLQQLVDVALRALSPGINDPTTATMCVDQAGSLLARLAGRHMPGALRHRAGKLRVIAPVPDFAVLCGMTLRPIVQQARGNLQVLARLLDALETVVAAAHDNERRSGMALVLADLRSELARVRPRGRARLHAKRLRLIERALVSNRDG